MSTTLATPATAVTTWRIDPAHSVAEFKVKHMMISNVKGRFTGVSGALYLDENNLANSRVEASIDAGSIATGDAQRDGHLKSADFFDVEKYPTLAFSSTRVIPDGEGELKATGELTIHGVTQVVPFHGFYAAEGYHQHFLDRNPNNPYIVYNDLPKLADLKKQYPQMCKR